MLVAAPRFNFAKFEASARRAARAVETIWEDA